MNPSIHLLGQSEEKIRRNWLFSTLFFFVIYPITLFSFLAILSQWYEISKDALIEPLGFAFQGVICLCMIWYTSYQKSRTGLLTFWLIINPCLQLFSLLNGLAEQPDGWTPLLITLDAGIFLWWYLLSLQLRKVNKSIQKRAKMVFS